MSFIISKDRGINDIQQTGGDRPSEHIEGVSYAPHFHPLTGRRDRNRSGRKRLTLLAGFGVTECLAVLIKTSVLSLSLALFIGAAAAQARSWPIVEGRQLQPTQQQVDSRVDDRARQRSQGVQTEIDRLYDEIMHGSR